MIARILVRTVDVVHTVGLTLLAARAVVEVRHRWEQRRKLRQPMPIEDQLDIAIHTHEIEEA